MAGVPAGRDGTKETGRDGTGWDGDRWLIVQVSPMARRVGKEDDENKDKNKYEHNGW